jgi:HD-GYP domain-containing protein (c-di-GMP phosphodiesterase class II)
MNWEGDSMEKGISMTDLIMCLSDIVDMVSPLLSNHHRRVTCIAHHIGSELGLPPSRQAEIVLAGAVHDVGAISLEERVNALQFDFEEKSGHSEKGYLLLRSYKPFSEIASIVRFHHTPWDYGGCAGEDPGSIPYGSHLLYLADRVTVLVKEGRDILSQADCIRRRVSDARGKTFIPELVDAFLDVSEKEYFWLDMIAPFPERFLEVQSVRKNFALLDEDMLGLMELFSRIIDFRSRFTAFHSNGVAAVAEALAGHAGFCQEECSIMKISGYIHDLGKLAVPPEILEKSSKLTREEFNIIKSHTYYTDLALRRVKGFEQIRKWGALHHERLDGKGYPFSLKGDRIPQGSRIMAVADVFVALTEDRPYRKGMPPERAGQILRSMVGAGALDSRVVSILEDVYKDIDGIRIEAQQRAAKEYRDFCR